MSASSDDRAVPPAGVPQASEGAALVHQGASVSVSPSTSPDSLLGVPPWARILLGRVWQGTSIDDARAMAGSKVSRGRVLATGRQFPAWYQMLMDAQQGVLDHCPVLPGELTRAHAWSEEERRHKLAMEASERYAHPYMQLGAQIRGDIGQARVQVQVNTLVQVPMRPDTAPGRRTIEGQVEAQEAQEPGDDTTPAATPSGA